MMCKICDNILFKILPMASLLADLTMLKMKFYCNRTIISDDWSPVIQPDLLNFVPYVWRFDFKFTDALIVLPVSQHNWVDCIQNRIENSETGG